MRMKTFPRIAMLLLLIAGLAFPNISTLATITGSGVAVPIGAGSARSFWVQCIAPATNSANVMFGDSTVTATRGLPIAPGAGYSTPTCEHCIYSPSTTWVYVASGDTIACAVGN